MTLVHAVTVSRLWFGLGLTAIDCGQPDLDILIKGVHAIVCDIDPAGMGSGAIEQNIADMEVQPTADVALKHKGVSVGIKSAHFSGPEWDPYIKAEEVGKIAGIPVMVDFGGNVRNGRTLYDLL